MALIPCPECQTKVASSAVACPSCGAPIQTIQAILRDGNSPQYRNACPRCGKSLPPLASICIDCNVNVKTGKTLDLPSPGADQRSASSATRAILAFIAIAALGLASFRSSLLQDMLKKVGLGGGTTERAPATVTPPAAPTVPAAPSTTPALRKKSGILTPGREEEDIDRPGPAAACPSTLPAGSVAAASGDSPSCLLAVSQIPGMTDTDGGAEPPQARAEPQSAASRPPSRPATRPAPQRVETVLLSCSLCAGKGHLPIPGSTRWTYPCPQCAGGGARNLCIPAGHERCPQCGGMGRISKLDDFRKINKRYVAVPCPTCRTTGACDR